MTYWNHRVMRQYHGEDSFDAIYEVYYDENDNVDGWTEEPVGPRHYVEIDEGSLLDQIERMIKATEKPILDYNTGKEIEDV